MAIAVMLSLHLHTEHPDAAATAGLAEAFRVGLRLSKVSRDVARVAKQRCLSTRRRDEKLSGYAPND